MASISLSYPAVNLLTAVRFKIIFKDQDADIHLGGFVPRGWDRENEVLSDESFKKLVAQIREDIDAYDPTSHQLRVTASTCLAHRDIGPIRNQNRLYEVIKQIDGPAEVHLTVQDKSDRANPFQLLSTSGKVSTGERPSSRRHDQLRASPLHETALERLCKRRRKLNGPGHDKEDSTSDSDKALLGQAFQRSDQSASTLSLGDDESRPLGLSIHNEIRNHDLESDGSSSHGEGPSSKATKLRGWPAFPSPTDDDPLPSPFRRQNATERSWAVPEGSVDLSNPLELLDGISDKSMDSDFDKECGDQDDANGDHDDLDEDELGTGEFDREEFEKRMSAMQESSAAARTVYEDDYRHVTYEQSNKNPVKASFLAFWHQFDPEYTSEKGYCNFDILGMKKRAFISQLIAVHFMLERTVSTGVVILADYMGMGKTVTLLCFLLIVLQIEYCHQQVDQARAGGRRDKHLMASTDDDPQDPKDTCPMMARREWAFAFSCPCMDRSPTSRYRPPKIGLAVVLLRLNLIRGWAKKFNKMFETRPDDHGSDYRLALRLRLISGAVSDNGLRRARTLKLFLEDDEVPPWTWLGDIIILNEQAWNGQVGSLLVKRVARSYHVPFKSGPNKGKWRKTETVVDEIRKPLRILHVIRDEAQDEHAETNITWNKIGGWQAHMRAIIVTGTPFYKSPISLKPFMPFVEFAAAERLQPKCRDWQLSTFDRDWLQRMDGYWRRWGDDRINEPIDAIVAQCRQLLREGLRSFFAKYMIRRPRDAEWNGMHFCHGKETERIPRLFKLSRKHIDEANARLAKEIRHERMKEETRLGRKLDPDEFKNLIRKKRHVGYQERIFASFPKLASVVEKWLAEGNRPPRAWNVHSEKGKSKETSIIIDDDLEEPELRMTQLEITANGCELGGKLPYADHLDEICDGVEKLEDLWTILENLPPDPESGEPGKMVVTASKPVTVAILKLWFEKRGVVVGWLHSAQDALTRANIMTSFEEPTTLEDIQRGSRPVRVLLGPTRICNAGLDLEKAETIVQFDPDPVSTVEDQLASRISRHEQRAERTYMYQFFTDNPLDQRIKSQAAWVDYLTGSLLLE